MLIVITSETKINNEAQLINTLFEAGLERLHIRKPTFSEKEYAVFISKINSGYYPKIFLHEHHALVEKYNLGGQHFRKKDNPIPLSIKTPRSTGVHSIKEFKEKESYYDYLLISPVFESISKIGYRSEENLSIQQLNVDLKKKAVALGGITISNIQIAQKMGYSNFAVLGSIWTKKNPLSAFKEMMEILKP